MSIINLLNYFASRRNNYIANFESYDPPPAARSAAREFFEVRRSKPKSQRGATAVGIARARDLAGGKKLSYKTVKRMKAYFDRHQVDKKGSTWGNKGKGYQAWQSWGGDAGYKWAKSIVNKREGK